MKAKKDILLVPPKSLVRYPRAAILSLYAAVIALYFTPPAGMQEILLTLPAIWLILFINDREEQRKGFFEAFRQITEQS